MWLPLLHCYDTFCQVAAYNLFALEYKHQIPTESTQATV